LGVKRGEALPQLQTVGQEAGEIPGVIENAPPV
jgi:hypothetical protein